MLKGSCLCGGIQYEIDADLGPVTNCHCGQCRKASGSAFASNASVPAASFRFVAGAGVAQTRNVSRKVAMFLQPMRFTYPEEERRPSENNWLRLGT
jgi:hypothetical protein